MARKQGHNIPSGPLFGAAYPAEHKIATARPVRTWAVIGVLAALGISLVVLARSQGTTPAPLNRTHTAAIKSVKSKQKGASSKSISYYTSAVRANLFAPPLPPAPQVAPAPVVRPMPIDPLGGWSYTGTVYVNGKVQALVEPSNGQPGQWVSAGSYFMGGKVESVSQTEVKVNLNGENHTLQRSDTINPVPLNANAPAPAAPATPKPAVAAPTAPAAATAMPAFTPPAGFKITPQMRKMWARMRRQARRGK